MKVKIVSNSESAGWPGIWHLWWSERKKTTKQIPHRRKRWCLFNFLSSLVGPWHNIYLTLFASATYIVHVHKLYTLKYNLPAHCVCECPFFLLHSMGIPTVLIGPNSKLDNQWFLYSRIFYAHYSLVWSGWLYCIYVYKCMYDTFKLCRLQIITHISIYDVWI